MIQPYMQWAKLHARARYELTNSSMPTPDRHDFDTRGCDISIENEGPYGDPTLISAIASRYGINPECVVPVPGTSSANFIAMGSICSHGNSALIEDPVYDPFHRIAGQLGLKVVRLPRRADNDFDIDIGAMEHGLNQGARTVVVTNLHNPSGQWLSVEQTKRMAERCAAHGATLLVDEVYLDAVSICKGQPIWTAATLGENVIVTSSLTKVYGLSGLRLGWLIASPRLAERARELMDILSVVNAAPSASLGIMAFERIDSLSARYDRLWEQGQAVYRQWLSEQRHVTGYANHGAIFECVRLPPGVSSVALNQRLVTDHDTQVVPGGFFGLDDHVRISLTLPPNDLGEALTRVSRGVDEMMVDGS